MLTGDEGHGWTQPGLTLGSICTAPLHPFPPQKSHKQKLWSEFPSSGQAELSSHPGFTAGILVPASHGEELLAFQVCTKPSNLSSHGGVIKAVPTKQNELNCFPRPGESVLGSGKNPSSPLCWSQSCQQWAQRCLAQRGSMPHARERCGRGLPHADMQTTLPDFPVLCGGASGLLPRWRGAQCLEITRLPLHPRMFLVCRFRLCSK